MRSFSLDKYCTFCRKTGSIWSKRLLIRPDQDHFLKKRKLLKGSCDPSSAGEQSAKGRQLHIRMIVKSNQPEWGFQFLQPDTAHIVIVPGINKMHSLCRKFFQFFFQNLRCLFIAVAVASRQSPVPPPRRCFVSVFLRSARIAAVCKFPKSS